MADLGATEGPLTFEELALAARNHAMPLEALRYDITPAGLHYLLIHFDIPPMDDSTFMLTVDGDVSTPFALDLEQIRALPARTIPVTMECAGNGRARLQPRPLSQPWLTEAVGTAEWTGTPLRGVLERAGLSESAVEIVFTGADRGVQGEVVHNYERSLPVAEAMRDDVLLVYAMNGQALLPQHGAPLRLLVPGWYGMTSVKWLTGIRAVSEPFDGYQQAVAYKYQRDDDDPGEPVSRILPRALMIPPGVPDFFTRARIVEAGPVALRGRAWSGFGEITRVEVAVDGNWTDAELDAPLGDYAWRGWTARWNAVPGEHVLSCRATDSAGNVQPLEQPWNIQGMSNNLVQMLSVTVS